jgi:hypothetical protein
MNDSKVSVACAHCKCPLAEPEKRTFCSRVCRAAASRKRVTRECRACGKEFQTERSRGGRLYCCECGPSPTATLARRFWRRVNRDGPTIRAELGPCWLWTGALDKDGYGNIRVDSDSRGRTVFASRAAFFVANARWPRVACHHCDNAACVRPEHIYDGTKLTNVQDRVARNRGYARLTREQVAHALDLSRGGMSCSAIARNLNVSATTIQFIVNGRAWLSVPR